MLLRLAYRNIWRNKRRTLITAASILFAVFFAIIMKSIQKGAWDYMVDSVVHFYFGYAQVHADGYWEDQSLNKAFDLENFTRTVELNGAGKHVDRLVPRLESFALASSGEKSKGVLLIGVDPEKENLLTGLKNRIVDGGYFNGGSVLLAEGLAEYFKLSIGDTVIFITQGYHGVNAAGKYPVSGLVSFGSPELNDQIAFLPLQESQWFYGADGRVTSLVVDVRDPDKIRQIVRHFRKNLPDGEYEVLDYEELIPDLIEARELDEAGGTIILAILYAIIAFGIFGTMLMMLKEREYEFGILKAIGMKTAWINGMVWLEMAFLGLVGTIAGTVVSLPVVWYLTVNPIRFTGEMAEAYEQFGVEAVLPATVEPWIFVTQALVVLGMTTIMTIYPMIRIRNLDPVHAMHA